MRAAGCRGAHAPISRVPRGPHWHGGHREGGRHGRGQPRAAALAAQTAWASPRCHCPGSVPTPGSGWGGIQTPPPSVILGSGEPGRNGWVTSWVPWDYAEWLVSLGLHGLGRWVREPLLQTGKLRPWLHQGIPLPTAGAAPSWGPAALTATPRPPVLHHLRPGCRVEACALQLRPGGRLCPRGPAPARPPLPPEALCRLARGQLEQGTRALGGGGSVGGAGWGGSGPPSRPVPSRFPASPSGPRCPPVPGSPWGSRGARARGVRSRRAPWPAVLPQLRRRVLGAGRAVCGRAGPPAPEALPLPAGAGHAPRPSPLRHPALPQLVRLFLERGEAWGGRGRGVGRGPSGPAAPSPGSVPVAPLQCSEACGGGEQQRLVTCPEPGLCEEALRPNSTRSCNTQPCTKWVVGPWGQVSCPRPPLRSLPRALRHLLRVVAGPGPQPAVGGKEKARAGPLVWRALRVGSCDSVVRGGGPRGRADVSVPGTDF